MEERVVHKAGTIHIDLDTFIKDLLSASGKKKTELTKECGVNDAYLSNCARNNNIAISVFKYFCAVYKLDENKYKNPEKKKEIAESVDSGEVLKVLNSINLNMFAILEQLKEIKKIQLTANESIKEVHGKVANCNVNTYEIKKNFVELNKTLGVEKPKE